MFLCKILPEDIVVLKTKARSILHCWMPSRMALNASGLVFSTTYPLEKSSIAKYKDVFRYWRYFKSAYKFSKETAQLLCVSSKKE